MAKSGVNVVKSDLLNETRRINENDYDEPLRNYTIDDYWPVSNETMPSDIFAFGMTIQHLILIVMCLFLIFMVLIIAVSLNARLWSNCGCVLRRICSNWRRRRAQRPRISVIDGQHANTNGGYSHARKGLLARMIARIEEFDSLTPLIITPSSLSDEDALPTSRSPRMRRGFGKITLIPMGSGLRRNDFAHAGDSLLSEEPVIMTRHHVPMAPIHENNTNGSSCHSTRNPFEELDLVSIDRTSFNSSLDRRTPGDAIDSIYTNHVHTSQRAPLANLDRGLITSIIASKNGNTDTAPCLVPTSSSTVATVHQPTMSMPPSSSAHSLSKVYLKPDANGRSSRKESSPSMDSISSNLSSPLDSVGDSGSPLDTTGSIAELSDSVYMASESDVSEAKVAGKIYSTDTGSVQRYNNGDGDKSEPDLSTFEYDTPAGKRYLLHRIEEESEDIDHSLRDPDSTTTNSALRSQRHQKKKYSKHTSDR